MNAPGDATTTPQVAAPPKHSLHSRPRDSCASRCAFRAHRDGQGTRAWRTFRRVGRLVQSPPVESATPPQFAVSHRRSSGTEPEKCALDPDCGSIESGCSAQRVLCSYAHSTRMDNTPLGRQHREEGVLIEPGGRYRRSARLGLGSAACRCWSSSTGTHTDMDPLRSV